MNLIINLKIVEKIEDTKTGKTKIRNTVSIPIPTLSIKRRSKFIQRELASYDDNVKSYNIRY